MRDEECVTESDLSTDPDQRKSPVSYRNPLSIFDYNTILAVGGRNDQNPHTNHRGRELFVPNGIAFDIVRSAVRRRNLPDLGSFKVRRSGSPARKSMPGDSPP
jgi:hypothetical protein